VAAMAMPDAVGISRRSVDAGSLSHMLTMMRK
jgi:hypothetical protein